MRYEQLVQAYKGLKGKSRTLLNTNNKLMAQLITNVDSGLPNAVVAYKQLDATLNADASNKAVIFLKLNEIFALVRRTFPTKIPEWILYQTGVRIMAILKNEGKTYHTRDDEFLIVLKRVTDEASLIKKINDIVEIAEQPHVLGGYNISLRVNLGVALFPRDGSLKSDILRSADIALSVASHNQVPFFLFNPRLKLEQMERIEIQNGMLNALQKSNDGPPQFQMYYQPQVELLDPASGRFRIVGAEALVRWKHPSMGFLSPAKFIPIAEETGLIVPLGTWILHNSIYEAGEWMKMGLGHVVMGINLSTRQFIQDDLGELVLRLIEKLRIPRKALKFEITEGTLMNNVTESAKKMESMLKMGFVMMLDDFGTGYSSLSYLKNLPISIIKIDKSFVDGLPHDISSIAPVKAIITMAREMQKGIIVEGVETKDQVEWLYSQGCRIFQGYYFSKPLPDKEFREFALAHTIP